MIAWTRSSNPKQGWAYPGRWVPTQDDTQGSEKAAEKGVTRETLPTYAKRSKFQLIGFTLDLTHPWQKNNRKNSGWSREENNERDLCEENVTFFDDVPFDVDGSPDKRNNPPVERHPKLSKSVRSENSHEKFTLALQ